MVVLGEQSFLLPETAGLRCLNSRLLAQHSLSERSPAVAANEGKARRLAPNLSPSEQQGWPGLPRAPLSGELAGASPTERFNGSSERSIGYNGRREQQLPAARRGRKVTEGCIERLSRSRSQYGRDGGQDAVPGHRGAGDEPQAEFGRRQGGRDREVSG